MATSPAKQEQIPGGYMTSDQIREGFLSFFEERGHLRLPSAPLIPPEHDPSALFTVAGMHPLKAYFLGREAPPARRLTDCQKCFRTVDIEQVGATNRHLTFFEMLGNFSIGDYFKREAIAFALELSETVFAFPRERIWVTVFGGDEELGLGPDQEAIEIWEEVGIPRERIVRCGRSENFWQAGPTGPCGPCSELYLDRGLQFGAEDERPGGEGERFLEYWNLVFMEYNQDPPNVIAKLPAKNIDTGLGLNRLAAIKQGKPSVFETDQFWPLIALGEELAGVHYGSSPLIDRALRILADHARATTFLIADGVVPSNEERGYVLRRVMRRAIHQGRVLGLGSGFFLRFAEVVKETMGSAYPELAQQWQAVERWVEAEERSFGRTLEEGLQRLEQLVAEAKREGAGEIPAEEAFYLHDTAGFPFELTKELLAEQGLSVDEVRFGQLMEEQRRRARQARAAGDGSSVEEVLAELAAAAPPSRFTGYEHTEEETVIVAARQLNGRWLVKLADSPFYPVGGGQVSDRGRLECLGGSCTATVVDVHRLGEDQVLEVELQEGEPQPKTPVRATVERESRFATECHHTATHLLHAALRRLLGPHVRQAGSYVGPDKLRFDFTHPTALTAAERTAIEDQVNAWIAADDPVVAITTTRKEAERLGAMALFGEKYGEIVRMVQIGDGSYSRELCGGTHVRYTAELGVFVILSESSSAANVRRIEALAGPPAAAYLRSLARERSDLAARLKVPPQRLGAELERILEERAALRDQVKELDRLRERELVERLVGEAQNLPGGGKAVVAALAEEPPAPLAAIAESVRQRLGEGAVVVLAPGGQGVSVAVRVANGLVAQGLDAAALVKEVAGAVGGKGGGKPTAAQGGGPDRSRIGEAVAKAWQLLGVGRG